MPRNNEIQFRRGTGLEWSAADSILSSGEPGWNSTNNTLKIGDGISTWNTLPTTASLLEYRNISSDTTLNYSNHIIFIDTSTNIVNVQLPLASGHGGKQFIFKQKSGSNIINIYPSGSETIDDKNTFQIFYEKNAISVVSDNSNWYII